MELVLSNTYNGKQVTIKTAAGHFDAVGEGFSVWAEQIRFGKLLGLQVPVTTEEIAAIESAVNADRAARQAERDAQQALPGISAKYAGTCAKTGIRYSKGARIQHTEFGWALVGTTLDTNYNMSREDSHL